MSAWNLADKLHKHWSRWESAYNVLGQSGTILSAMAGLLGILIAFLAVRESTRATAISSAALAQSEKALALQQSEFRIRNRPYLFHMYARFSDDTTDSYGVVYPHGLETRLYNLSEIPANNVVTRGVLYINGQHAHTSEVTESGVVRDHPVIVEISLRPGLYEQIHVTTNNSYAEFTTTYSGILGEPPAAYTSRATIIFNPVEKEFRIEGLQIR